MNADKLWEAIRNPKNADDACEVCRHKEWLMKEQRRRNGVAQ